MVPADLSCIQRRQVVIEVKMMQKPRISLFDLSRPQHRTAADLFEGVYELPLVCPHTHVDPSLFVNPDTRFTDPTALFVTSDHYVLRMLVSQGFSFEQLGLSQAGDEEEPYDPQAVWQIFCDHFHCFDGTPSGLWIENSLAMVFGIDEKPNSFNVTSIYNEIQSAIEEEKYAPRALYDRFNIETLCTTDQAADRLDAHHAIQMSGWGGDIRPTFRLDGVIHIGRHDWREELAKLSKVSSQDIRDYRTYLMALEQRRAYFKSSGAVASDLAAETAFTYRLSAHEAEAIFQHALQGEVSASDARRFSGHMVIELARMSVEDSLVMQFHVGSYRNHNPGVYNAYGADKGFDIPLQVEWTQNLKPLLDAFGMDTRLRLILFTLDESGYTRELAPLAGAYPAVKLGPPWWFHDSPNGIMRYFESVMETAGIDNTVGFNDDTRAFFSIPARHDLWRRMAALWLAKLVHRSQLNLGDARHRMVDLAYGLAKRGYRLD